MRPALFAVQSIGDGSLTIMAKPESGDSMETEFASIKASGIDKIVSLLESHESNALGLREEKVYTEKNSMIFVSYPILDRGMPPSVSEFSHFTKQLYSEMSGGLHILVHCHGGIGRSGIVAASVLLHCGFSAVDAFLHISNKRGIAVPDTQEQIDWVVSNTTAIIGS